MEQKLLIRAITALETIGEHLAEIDSEQTALIRILEARLENTVDALYKGFSHLAESLERHR